MERFGNIKWRRILLVVICSIFWIEIVSIALKAWPNDSILNGGLFYRPETISPASVIFVIWLLVGFYYGAMTGKNFLWLAVCVWGIIGLWNALPLKTSGLFPSLHHNSFLIFGALYTAACLSRFTVQLFGIVPKDGH